MKAVESEGSTIDQAVERALILLDLPIDLVDVEVIREPRTGDGTAIVRVAPRGQSKVSRETSAAQGTKHVDRAAGDQVLAPEESEQVRALLAELLSHMDLACQVEPGVLDEDGQRMRFKVGGEDASIVIGRQGQTLDAIELVINRMVDRRWPGSTQVTVDAEEYRARRARKLTEIAHQQAGNVRKSGRPVALEPMSPRDRRSVHLALHDEPGVSTRSEGEGSFRHIVIEPAGPLGLSGSRPRFR